MNDEITVWNRGDAFVVTEPISFSQHEKLVAALGELGVELSVVDMTERVRTAMFAEIRSHGVSQLLSRVWLQEFLVAPKARPSAFAELVSSMLADLSPKQSIQIVDPYLLEPGRLTPNEHANVIVDLLGDITSLKEVGLFYKPRTSEHKADVICALDERLDAAGFVGVARHHHTHLIHDRFLIVDGRHGIVMGSSINGIGKKYFLVDFLDHSDAVEIATVLSDIPGVET